MTAVGFTRQTDEKMCYSIKIIEWKKKEHNKNQNCHKLSGPTANTFPSKLAKRYFLIETDQCYKNLKISLRQDRIWLHQIVTYFLFNKTQSWIPPSVPWLSSACTALAVGTASRVKSPFPKDKTRWKKASAPQGCPYLKCVLRCHLSALLSQQRCLFETASDHLHLKQYLPKRQLERNKVQLV